MSMTSMDLPGSVPNMTSTSQVSMSQTTIGPSIENPTARGTLSVLPPEIRNEIYSIVFSKSYLVFRSLSSFVIDDHEHFKDIEGLRRNDPNYYWSVIHSSRIYSDLAILRTSRTIYDEALGVLGAKSNFQYIMDFSHGEHTHTSAPTIEITNKMQNITVEITNIPIKAKFHVHWTGVSQFAEDRATDRWSVENIGRLRDATIGRFGGSVILRYAITIRLQQYGFRSFDVGWSVILHALGQLTGFQTVTLHLMLPYWLSRVIHKERLTDEDMERHVKDMDRIGTVVEGIRAVLESTLGRAESGLAIGGLKDNRYVYLEFHPRGSVTSKVKIGVFGDARVQFGRQDSIGSSLNNAAEVPTRELTGVFT